MQCVSKPVLKKLKYVVECLTQLPCIWEVLGSYLGSETVYSDLLFVVLLSPSRKIQRLYIKLAYDNLHILFVHYPFIFKSFDGI